MRIKAGREPFGSGGLVAGQKLPLTDAQAEKWLGGHYNKEAALAFGEAFELNFEGVLDGMALDVALDQVCARHEALSMRFEADGSGQVYEPPHKLHLQHLDFSQSEDPALAYTDHVAKQIAIPFNPGLPPLVRTFLCRLGPNSSRLLMLGHHLLFDGWSLRVILNDLVAIYNAIVTGTPARLAPADSWADYVLSEQATRTGPTGQRSQEYWLKKFADLPEPLRLPVDQPRQSRLSFQASSFSVDVPAELWVRLKQSAREQKVTRYTLLIAGYFVLLYRLTGQTDMVCGVPFAGAARGSGSRTVGDTDNTLPLRITIQPDEPSSALLQRMQILLKEAAEHQDISLGRILDTLNPPREPGRLTLVETIVSLAPPIRGLTFHGVECSLNVLPRLASAWELAFHWRQMPGSLSLELQYHSELYDETTLRAWVSAYLEILNHFAQGTSACVADLPLVPAADRQGFALINDQYPASHAGPQASLTDLLQESFERHGDRIAAQCGEVSLTYSELARRSRDAAVGLLHQGVCKGELVGISMSRSVDMLVAVLAVLRAGAAYVPLDRSFPPDRLAFMAKHADLGRIVVDACRGDGGDEGHVPQPIAGQRLSLESLESSTSPPIELPICTATSLAYVLYTSGSTGEPKGVRILHSNLVNFLLSMRDKPGFSEQDAICAATTLSFDIAALELYLPLLCGGRVVIADDAEHRDPESLCRLIERRQCTVFQTTPSLLALLQEVGRIEVLKPLRLLVGGEAFPPSLRNALLPHCRELWNLYGPTETTVWSSVARLHSEVAAPALGKPIARTRLYLLDPRGQPTLPGALGEIYIGGAGVADGYLHRPDLTAERFLPDPFVNSEAAVESRMYRTGDIGKIREGQLYFQGRADDQIKLRGYRIEPGEIESLAALDSRVTECVAVARRFEGGDKVLVLYVGSSFPAGALASDLRTRCSEGLPGYMRPHHIVVLQQLPKTPNGKIDRRSLPAPNPDERASGRTLQLPRDGVEQGLLDQWKRLLSQSNFGIHDNFFELGGHSLMAVRMFTEINQQYGVDLPLASLIERPTIAGLAELLRPTFSTSPQAFPETEETTKSDGRRAWEPLVVLKAGHAIPALFLFHAVGGNVLNYLPLLASLPEHQPVYGLQSPGLDGLTRPLASINEMADVYLCEIRRAQPAGPYLLGGGSMGGLLAHEVARRLSADGHKVALLAMLDTYGPEMKVDPANSPWRPHRWWSLYRRLSPEQRVAIRNRIGLRLLRLPLAHVAHWFAPAGRPAPQTLRIHRVEQANLRALRDFHAGIFPGKITLFRTRRTDPHQDASLGWKKWAASVEIIELPGRHDNFVGQPELAVHLGACIETCLQSLRA